MIQSEFLLSHSRQFGIGAGSAATIVALWLAFNVTGSGSKVLAVCSAAGAGMSVLSLVAQTSSETSTHFKGVLPSPRPPLNYISEWTMSGQPERGVSSGNATAYDFGDRVIIRQEEAKGGTYILDLKRAERNLTGVWWFYGGHPPQGMFRGKIAEDGLIQASWQGPGGETGGAWTLMPTLYGNAQDDLAP